MAISLRVAVLLLVGIVGAAAAVIALVPVREAGMRAVRSTAALLRVEIADRLAGDLLGYFQAPMYAIAALRDQHRVGLINSTGNLLNLVPSIASTSQRLGLPVYVANPADEVCYVKGSGTVLWYGGVHNSSTTEWWEWDGKVNTTDFSWVRTTPGFLSDYRPSQRPWYASVAANQSWGPVYVEHLSTSVTTVSPGGPMNNPTTGALEGVAVVDVRNDFLLDYFSTVVIAKRGRAMLLHTKSRACLGGNWNESAVIPINGSWEDSRLASVHDLHEPLFAQTVSVLGEDGLFNTSLPHRTEFGTGKDAVYVDIVQIADSYGLDLRLLVMIPEKDFLEDVDVQVNTTIGAALGAVLALIIIAFLFCNYLVVSPLRHLTASMGALSDLNMELVDELDQEAGDCRYAVHEVHSLSQSYDFVKGTMKQCLPYLPQPDGELRLGKEVERETILDMPAMFLEDISSVGSSRPESVLDNPLGASPALDQEMQTSQSSSEKPVGLFAKMPGMNTSATNHPLSLSKRVASASQAGTPLPSVRNNTMQKELTLREDTVVAHFRLRPDLQWAAGDELFKEMSYLLQYWVTKLASEHKGTVHHLGTNSMGCVWAGVAQQEKKAVETATAVLEAMLEKGVPLLTGKDLTIPVATVGIVRGPVLLGTTGTLLKRTYVCEGPAVQGASILSHVGHQVRAHILTDTALQEGAAMFAELRPVEEVRIPNFCSSFAKHAASIITVWECIGFKGSADISANLAGAKSKVASPGQKNTTVPTSSSAPAQDLEWMYQLEANQKAEAKRLAFAVKAHTALKEGDATAYRAALKEWVSNGFMENDLFLMHRRQLYCVEDETRVQETSGKGEEEEGGDSPGRSKTLAMILHFFEKLKEERKPYCLEGTLVGSVNLPFGETDEA